MCHTQQRFQNKRVSKGGRGVLSWLKMCLNMKRVKQKVTTIVSSLPIYTECWTCLSTHYPLEGWSNFIFFKKRKCLFCSLWCFLFIAAARRLRSVQKTQERRSSWDLNSGQEVHVCFLTLYVCVSMCVYVLCVVDRGKPGSTDLSMCNWISLCAAVCSRF